MSKGVERMSEHLIHINPQTKAVDMIDIRMYEELQTQYDRLSIANKQDEQTHREMWQEQEAKIEALKQENDKLKEALNECLGSVNNSVYQICHSPS